MTTWVVVISDDNAARLRGLIYSVQFEIDPVEGVERVVEFVVDRHVLNSSPQEFLAAIDEGLHSKDRLADLIPQDHGEIVIRRFLSATAAAIRARWP